MWFSSYFYPASNSSKGDRHSGAQRGSAGSVVNSMTYIKEALGVTKTPVPVVGHCMRPWLGAQEVEGGCSAASCSIPQLPFQLCITPGSGKVTGITYLLLSTAQFHLIGIHTLQKQEPAANIFSINQPNLC